MGLFGQSSGFDADVEKATSETNTNENWSLILDVCDKTSSNPRNAKDCLKAIMKRMGHNDPHVVMQAITLLDACVSNCGKPFHLEIASREFQTEFQRLLGKSQPKVSSRMCQVLKGWAESDFKTDPELNLIPTLYDKLRHENYDFSGANDKPSKSATKTSVAKDTSVNNKQEQDDLAKAIELSLKEVKNSPKLAAPPTSGNSNQYASLYPTVTTSTAPSTVGNAAEPRKVRALYDFEAAEENELTFVAGDIIHVIDDSDPNWWKGFNQRGEGLFPSNFVTADLTVDPERLEINQQHKLKKSEQFEEDTKELQHKTEAAAVAAASQQIDIDEQKIDRLLHLLNEANPEDPSQDTEEMLRLEQEVHQMGPLIDAELERVDRKHAQLSQLSSDLVDAINLYHSLMRDDRNSSGLSYTTGSLPGMVGLTNYHGMPQHPHMMYRTDAAYQSNFGTHSLQSGLSSMAFSNSPANYHPQMGMSMRYPNEQVNNQHQAHHQVLPQHESNQALPPQQLLIQQGHSQHQIYPSANGPSQVPSSTCGDSPQQSTQHQTYQGLPLAQLQQFVAPLSSSVATNGMTNHEGSTLAGQASLPQFMSPQHRPPQQSQTFGNGTSPQTLPNPQTFSHHSLSNGPITFMPNQPGQHLQANMTSASPLEQFGQMQQQMNDMPLTNQPYPTTIQQNIPIFQQQR